MATNDDGWIGVDFDGVLVEWDPKYMPGFGPPIPTMIERVRAWLAEGTELRILTARVTANPKEPAWLASAASYGFTGGTPSEIAEAWIASQAALIDNFSYEWFGRRLPITAEKDWRMRLLYDDRCVQMIPNTGISLAEEWESRLAVITDKLDRAYRAANLSFEEAD